MRKGRLKKKPKKHKMQIPSFNRYGDRDVQYFGVPYAQSKSIDGVWYMRTTDGTYKPFPIQERVIEMPKKRPL